ncbi:uncharacterized protein F4822DRAFT_392635 [Hypoxylon trugodes]|uniref:uncharacterized protein n=1 Tax=Hypoxylon trugodes TaxID=326681 RepID=UPI0021944D0D|nr:uncharacterized protein F4822DRAFT_392635 [Hypoxylon trugodes]KAI1392938.1 hypothetical protein F4822DRAFT_392635 [Hypoxylon trugodes]
MMYSSTPAIGAALLFSLASAVPNVRPRDTTDAALQPWVTVNDDGKPSTVTPVLSTVSGTPTVISGAPHDLTATVFTETSYGKVSTSTGTAPMATATGGEGAGSFQACHNKDGDGAPWCQPTAGSPLYPGVTYYFTWDPSYFTVPNTTILVQGNYVNETTGEVTDQAFESPKWSASWGFWSYKIEESLMKYQSAKNITLQLATLATGGNASQIISGPTVLITHYPGYQPDTGKTPDKTALAIALPTVLGFVALCLVGTCLWNRRARKIGLGNIMSRGRHGYGVGKSARSRMGLGKRNKANERIQLMERELEADGGDVYRDMPDRPRRDSDALGSLAGTPTEERRMDFHGPGSRDQRDRNLFRDELRRQDNERL